MRVLVVGGTGLIGAHAARHLRDLNHDVTIGSRQPAKAAPYLPGIAGVCIDVMDATLSPAALSAFEGVVYCAGADIRQLPKGADENDFWVRANHEATPRFFQRAKEAGVKRAVYVGSYYHQIAPDIAARSPYVRSRMIADESARALNGGGFEICTVNPPSVTGFTHGQIVPHLQTRALFALGEKPDMPRFAIPGGTNFMSTRSLAEAIAGALTRGAPGKAYLVGDENLTYRQYLELFFEAAGAPVSLPVQDAPHPLFPDAGNYAGRGGSIFFEPDVEERALLGYGRHDMKRTIQKIVAFYKNSARS